MIEFFVDQNKDMLSSYQQLTDPVYHCLMLDSVILSDGKTLDRESAQAWFSTGNTNSPIDRLPLAHTNLTSNLFARQIIMKFIEDNAGKIKETYKQNVTSATLKTKL